MRLEDFLLADFDAPVGASEQIGDDLLVSLGDGNEVRIESFALSALGQNDFIFA